MSWLGRIYLARVPDPDGNEIDHDHPVMVFKGPDAAGNLYVLGISTKFDRPLDRFAIECPINEDTGLDRPCVLKCWWYTLWNVSGLKRYLGEMPEGIVERATELALLAKQEREREDLARSRAANQRSL